MNRKLLLAGLGMALMLCGCQKSPDSGAVISRNDGAFDASVIVSASEEHAPDETQSVEIFETFYSTDGSVEFRMEIQEELTNRNMPVVEVEPHFLTAEEVKRVGHVLFGNVDFYESQPWLAPNLSKRDIQEKINRWSPYASEEAVRSLYGDAAGQESQLTLIRDFLEKYTKLYEVAPEEETKETCRWEFRKSSCYFYAPEDITESSLKNDNDEISAMVKAGGWSTSIPPPSGIGRISKSAPFFSSPVTDPAPGAWMNASSRQCSAGLRNRRRRSYPRSGKKRSASCRKSNWVTG